MHFHQCTPIAFVQNFIVFASFMNADRMIQVTHGLLILNILSKFIMLFRYQSLAIFPHRMFSVVFRCFHLFPLIQMTSQTGI